MKIQRNVLRVILAFAASITLAPWASQASEQQCLDGNNTDVSLTVCANDNTDCHDRYWIGYSGPGQVEYEIVVHNGKDGKHLIPTSDGESEISKKIQRWNYLKDAYVESITCCSANGTNCTLILDESHWRQD